ncbi:hypothetical protein BJ742DRAFT_738180 [Cladochytrium replicatum]|nr:hypothetical protein BJ742DRAFT_738180 [Cladochytrium replicatum]
MTFLQHQRLLPFIGTTLGSIVHPESVFLLQEIQAGYGAVILSFMGAVHWGTAMTNLTPRAQTQLSPVPNGIRYALSTAPSLIAFFALPSVLGGGDWDVSGYAQLAGFNALLVADVLSAKMSLVPRWYTPLRIVLTLTVSGCIGLTLWIKGRRRSRINATSEKAK